MMHLILAKFKSVFPELNRDWRCSTSDFQITFTPLMPLTASDQGTEFSIFPPLHISWQNSQTEKTVFWRVSREITAAGPFPLVAKVSPLLLRVAH